MNIRLAISDLVDSVVIEMNHPKTDDEHDEVMEDWDTRVDSINYIISILEKMKGVE